METSSLSNKANRSSKHHKKLLKKLTEDTSIHINDHNLSTKPKSTCKSSKIEKSQNKSYYIEDEKSAVEPHNSISSMNSEDEE